MKTEVDSSGRETCPTREQLQDLVDGDPDEARLLAMENHIEGCQSCQIQLDLLLIQSVVRRPIDGHAGWGAIAARVAEKSWSAEKALAKHAPNNGKRT
ncbi:hypothetical protein CKO51_24605 [Rhodopirellula sp. SM50]|nr:zf-HC2 domain-containing protein [Rhodopirellula sp. SM50]PAY16821.1 hypothetical protein CKO51_24605 [Rhodopirellula sp. SM50]